MKKFFCTKSCKYLFVIFLFITTTCLVGCENLGDYSQQSINEAKESFKVYYDLIKNEQSGYEQCFCETNEEQIKNMTDQLQKSGPDTFVNTPLEDIRHDIFVNKFILYIGENIVEMERNEGRWCIKRVYQK